MKSIAIVQNIQLLTIHLYKNKKNILYIILYIIQYMNDQDTYNEIQNQNQQIQDQIDSLTQSYSLYDQKSYYQSQDIYRLYTVNWYLIIIYYVTVVFLIYFIYEYSKYSIFLNIIILVLLFAFPFIILPVERFIWDISEFIYNLIIGKVYSNVYKNGY
jgi:hypothetical protein